MKIAPITPNNNTLIYHRKSSVDNETTVCPNASIRDFLKDQKID